MPEFLKRFEQFLDWRGKTQFTGAVVLNPALPGGFTNLFASGLHFYPEWADIQVKMTECVAKFRQRVLSTGMKAALVESGFQHCVVADLWQTPESAP